MNSLTAEELKEEGLREEKRGTDLKPDKGFDYNPAVEKWTPDVSKYDPDLREQVEDAIFD